MFRYDPEVLTRFPTIRAGLVHATGLVNAPTPTELLAEFEAEQAATLTRLRNPSDGSFAPLSELTTLSAWRGVFAEFGVKPTRYRNAAESLLRRLTKQGSLPSINVLVDIGNLVSIRHGIPVAVMDQQHVSGETLVTIATGEEQFDDLGASTTINPAPGEVIFVDENASVSARRWCWRQSTQSASGSNTTEVLIVVEGHHSDAEQTVAAAAADVLDLLARYQPNAITRSATLSPQDPHFA